MFDWIQLKVNIYKFYGRNIEDGNHPDRIENKINDKIDVIALQITKDS